MSNGDERTGEGGFAPDADGKALRRIIEAAPVGIILVDAETHTIVDANAAAVALLGVAKESILGHVCHDFICPSMVGDCPITDRGQHTGRARRCLVTAEGRELPVLRSVTETELGGRRVLVESLVDVSDLVLTRAALQEREARYRDVIQTSLDGIISVDSDMKITLWNDGAERIFGYAGEEVLGRSLMRIVPERYHAAKRQGFDQFSRTGTGPAVGKTLELAGLRKDGAEVPIELTVTAREDEGGYLATAIIRDISERREAERARTLFRTLLDQSSDAIFVVEPEDGRFLDVNVTACMRLGYERDELLAMAVTDIETAFPDRLRWDDFARGLRKTGDAIVSGRHKSKDGSTYPVEVTARVAEVEGKAYFIAVARDDTQRRAAEEEREGLIGELQDALARVKTLRGLIPICAYCRKVRDDKGFWNQVEAYVQQETGATFSHGICPDCLAKAREELS